MAYAASTLLTLKKAVSAQLGKTDFATPDLVRDTKINDARREVYSSRRWFFLRKSVAVTFTAGSFPFPTDFGPDFDVETVYTYSGTRKIEWQLVETWDLPRYASNDTNQFVYAIDRQNFVILSNQQTGTPTMVYYAYPADRAVDGTEDSLAEPASKAAFTAIVLLATGEYWLAAERDEDEYDRYFARYQRQHALAVNQDSRMGAPESIPHALYGRDLGFNRD